jgi:uncharacterized protein
MRRVRRTVPASPDLGTGIVGVPTGSDLELDLRLEAVMEGVLVSGTVRAIAVGECVRCLVEVAVGLDVDLQELYAYPDRVVQAAPGDDEVREFEDDRIDLEPALRDAVVTALPFRPVCREDCPGLCPQCGIRLADHPGHQHETSDPRWEALRDLVPGGQGGHETDEQMTKES